MFTGCLGKNYIPNLFLFLNIKLIIALYIKLLSACDCEWYLITALRTDDGLVTKLKQILKFYLKCWNIFFYLNHHRK